MLGDSTRDEPPPDVNICMGLPIWKRISNPREVRMDWDPRVQPRETPENAGFEEFVRANENLP